MNEQYLWDQTGAPDPEVTRLEEVLARVRYQGSEWMLPEFQIRNQVPARRFHWAAVLTAAAALTLTISLTLYIRARRVDEKSTWRVSWAGGTVRPVRSGQQIETENFSAHLESDSIGEVQVDPDSRLRVTKTTRNQQRFDLEHGTIHALIWAPPKQFVVDTPSSTTIDLGCQYTLQVAADGSGSLQVESGWVAFQWRNIESFIPAGAACLTNPEHGPGAPYFQDAPLELRSGVSRFDSGNAKALDAIIAAARPRDALTLWHLLTRTRGDERSKVFDKFSEMVKLPPSVTKRDVMDGRPAALDGAWNALNLGDTDWWREWKRRW